jgi:uncharacterized protein (TIGR00251 family)
MAPAGHPWRTSEGCVIVRVRVTPRSPVDAVAGVGPTAEGLAIKARVRAPPAEGEANAALVRLIAGWLGVPKSAVSVAAGSKSRVKALRIAGEVRSLEDRLTRKLADLA